MILTVLLGILWLVVVPFGLGVAPCRLLPKEYRMPGMVFAIGYLIMMALFECVYLPALLLHMHFRTLCLIFRLIVGFFSLSSVIYGAKELHTLRMPRISPFLIVFVLAVIAECVARWFQGVTDGDDAYFIGTAVNAYFGNQIYNVNPYTGFESSLDIRHALSAGGLWVAYLANSAFIRQLRRISCMPTLPLFFITSSFIISDRHSSSKRRAKRPYLLFSSCFSMYSDIFRIIRPQPFCSSVHGREKALW